MSFIYITGAPGTGKSTIRQELRNHGFEAHDLDDPQFGGPYDKLSGQRVIIPPVDQRDDYWFDRHEWRIDRPALERLRLRSRDEDIIMCGVAESDDEVTDLFDKVLYLSLNDETLKDRLLSRRDNDYGKKDSELLEIIGRKKKLDSRYTGPTVRLVDASRSVRSVIADVLRLIEE